MSAAPHIQTVKKSISSAHESIDWAEEELSELEAEIARFFQGDVRSRIVENDEQAGLLIYKIKLVKEIPSRWRRHVSGILANVRNAFDQATYAAVVSKGGSAAKTIYFPWSETPADLEGHLKRRAIPPIFWECFRFVEPYPASEKYPGGDDNIRALAQIAGKFKHIARLGIDACATGYSFPGEITGGDSVTTLQELRMPEWDTVKNEMVVARYSPDTAFEYDCEVAFHITFDEATPPLKCEALPLLKTFASKARAFSYGIAAHLS